MRGCKRIAHMLGPYVYGDLDVQETREVRGHLERCERCMREFENATQTVEMIPRELAALSEDDKMRVTWAVKGAIRERERSRTTVRKRYLAFSLAAAGVVAIALGASVAINQYSNVPVVHQQAPAMPDAPPVAVAEPEPEATTDSQSVARVEPEPEPSPVATVRVTESRPAAVRVERAIGSVMAVTSRGGNSVERLPGDAPKEDDTETAEEDSPDSAELVAPPVPDGLDNVELVPELLE